LSRGASDGPAQLTVVVAVWVVGSSRQWSNSMLDTMMVVFGAAMFVLFVGYTVLCDKM
jgi:hypothetical protein